MEIKQIIFDENSFGITQRSLKVLRNTLSRSIDQHIAVVEIPTNDLCCGYLILNRDTGVATFTGDGFRIDGGGEGGAGYRSAQALMTLFGIKVFPADPVDLGEIYIGGRESVRRKLHKVAKELQGLIGDHEYIRISDRMPGYVR